MQVQIIGITKEMKTSKKDNTKKYFIVNVGYERADMDGLETKAIFLNEEMIKEANGYIPSVGDVCIANCTFGGYVTSLQPVQ